MKKPPLEFLLACSRVSLQDFELSRLNQIANLVKQVQTIQDELRQIEGEALLARWLMEHREELVSIQTAGRMQRSFEFTAEGAPPAKALPAKRIRGEITA